MVSKLTVAILSLVSDRGKLDHFARLVPKRYSSADIARPEMRRGDVQGWNEGARRFNQTSWQ